MHNQDFPLDSERTRGYYIFPAQEVQRITESTFTVVSKVKFWCSLKTLETVGNVSFEQAEPCSHRQFEAMATTKWRSFARNLVSATSLSKCVKRMLGKPVPVKFCAFFEKMSAPFCHFISMLSKRTLKKKQILDTLKRSFHFPGKSRELQD